MINLHAIVRNTVAALHPEEDVTLYQSLGQTNILGRIKPMYAEGVVVKAQIQSLSADELVQREDTSKTEIHAKAYIFADEAFPPSGIIRILARNGDFFRRADGSWWLITSVIDDFTKSGWECVGIVQQIVPPDFSGSGWYTEASNG